MKKGERIGLIQFATAFDMARASQAPALMTQRRQLNPLIECRVPDMFILSNADRALALGHSQSNVEVALLIVLLRHEAGSLKRTHIGRR